MSVTRAPWTEEQVKLLEEHQTGQVKLSDGTVLYIHPYTCANRSDHEELPGDRDRGTLTPTVDGWVCRQCDYKQDWAYL